MSLNAVNKRADDLATMVGPLETLLALARLEDALETLDRRMDGAGNDHDGNVIDLRETRTVLERIQPIISDAESRVDHLRSGLEGR